MARDISGSSKKTALPALMQLFRVTVVLGLLLGMSSVAQLFSAYSSLWDSAYGWVGFVDIGIRLVEIYLYIFFAAGYCCPKALFSCLFLAGLCLSRFHTYFRLDS